MSKRMACINNQTRDIKKNCLAIGDIVICSKYARYAKSNGTVLEAKKLAVV